MDGFKSKYLWCTHCAEKDWNFLRVTLVDLHVCVAAGAKGFAVGVPITFSAQSLALLLEAETKTDFPVIL